MSHVDSWWARRSSGLTMGSLFTGIGSLDYGVEMAFDGTLTTIWQVEQNEFAQKVLAKHWPNAKRYSDIREVNPRQLEPVDILTTGSPCQDLSLSGKRAGLAGARSGLWFETVRIIRDLRPRPRCVVWENVPGAFSPIRGGTAPIGRVLGDLAALGYDAWWDSISAQDVGAPQVRERAFVVAYRPGKRLEESQSCTQGNEREAAAGSRRRTTGTGSALAGLVRVPHGATGGLDAHRWPAYRGEAQVAGEPPRSAYGIANRKERIMAIGNTVTPQAAFVVGLVARELLLLT